MNLGKRYLDTLFRTEAIKSVAVVMTGTALSQIIALAVTPILTRNYDPADFGFFTTFIALFTVLTSFVTGKFERAILLSKDFNEIVVLSTLVLFISFSFSIIVGIVAILARLFSVSLFESNNTLNDWIFLLPFFLVFYAINIIFLTYLNYNKNYKEISKSRVIKTILSVIVSLLCIFFYHDVGGLILGEFVGLVISTIYLYPRLKVLFKLNVGVRSRFNFFISRYKNFPLYNIPSDLLNNSASQLPVFFLSSIFGIQATGQYSLMKRVLDAPVNLLSSSILDVFRQKASEQYIAFGNCRNLFIKTAKNLLIISIVPFLVLFIFGSYLFTLFFGDEWADAGKYASIFSFFYFFKFVSSPLSYVIILAEKQKIDFLLHIYIFLSSLVIFYLSDSFNFSIQNTLVFYSINFSLIYITYFVVSYRYSKK